MNADTITMIIALVAVAIAVVVGIIAAKKG